MAALLNDSIRGLRLPTTPQTTAPSGPQQVDVYGKGNRLADGTLKTNNPAMTAAIEAAYTEWQGSAKTQLGNRDAGTQGKLVVTGYGVSEKQALENQFKKAGLDPKLIPERADLAAYRSIGGYNGVGGDPLRLLQETERYQDGRTKDEANTRDFIAKGLANGQDTAQIWKNIEGYNDTKQGGWSKQNLGIGGDDLVKLIALGAAAYFALPLLTAAGGGTVGAAAAASGAGTASGLAGYMGMNVGYAATALNVGAINTGVALASGSNIGDALKAGAAAAAMSPLGAMAGAGVGGQLGGAVLEGAVNGGGAAALLGKDVVRGAVTGGVVGGATYGLGQLTADPSQIDYTNYDNGTAVGPAQPMPDGFDFSPGTPSAGAADLGTVNVSGSGGLNMSGAVNPASLGQVQVTGQRDPQAQQNSADEPGGLNPVTVTGKRDPITGNAVTEDDLKLLPMPGMPTDGTPAGEVGKTEDKKVEDKDKEKGYFDKYGKWIKPALGLIGAGGAAGAVGGGGTGGGQPAMGGTYTPDGIADDLWSNWKAGRQGLYDEADRVGADARRYQGFAEDSARGFGSDIDWLSGERDKYAGQADAAAAQMYGDAAKGRAEFDQYFAPTFAKYQTQVDKYNDPAYIGRLRGESMESAAALQQAGDAQALRGASRYGYGSGAMMDTLATRASDNARAKLGAALGTEQSLRGMYDQGLQNLNKMGQYAGDFGLRNADNMVNATRFGLDGKQKAADLGQRATTAIGTARTNQTSAYKSALDFSQTPLGLKTKLMGFESDIGKNTASIYTDSYRARTNQFGAETQRNQGDAKQSADNWKNVGGAIQWGLSKDGAAAWDTVKKWFPG